MSILASVVLWNRGLQCTIIQLSYTSTNVKCELVQVSFTSSSCYFVVFWYSSPQANDFRTGYNYLRATSTKTTAINSHSVPSIFSVQSLFSVITVMNATQLLSKKACSSLEFHHMAVRHKSRTNYIDELLHFYSCMYALLFSVYEKHYELNALTLLLR